MAKAVQKNKRIRARPEDPEATAAEIAAFDERIRFIRLAALRQAEKFVQSGPGKALKEFQERFIQLPEDHHIKQAARQVRKLRRHELPPEHGIAEERSDKESGEQAYRKRGPRAKVIPYWDRAIEDLKTAIDCERIGSPLHRVRLSRARHVRRFLLRQADFPVDVLPKEKGPCERFLADRLLREEEAGSLPAIS